MPSSGLKTIVDAGVGVGVGGVLEATVGVVVIGAGVEVVITPLQDCSAT